MKLSKKNIKNQLNNVWKNYSQWCISGGFIVLALIWGGAIFPLMDNKSSKQESLITANEELNAIKGWVAQIKSLENDLSVEQQTEASESLLQQVERIGKETKVFHKISRISPSKVRVDSREYEGISLEYEKTSMAEIAPFLEAISYKSVLDIHEITLQKYAEEDGIVSARLTLIGGKL
jgi:type II secretory pathway component PulM